MTESTGSRSEIPSRDSLRVLFSVEPDHLQLESERYSRTVTDVCRDAGFQRGEISIAVVGNQRMQQLHREYLDVDETTDVIAFTFEKSEQHLAGEIIVCWDVAQERSQEFNWTSEDELLLYVLHGALHLVGYDDATNAEFEKMRNAEEKYLAPFGLRLVGRDHSAHPEGETS